MRGNMSELQSILSIFHQQQTMSLSALQRQSALNDINPFYQGQIGIGQSVALSGGLLGAIMGSQLGMSHLGTVREFRKKFKEYSKAEFREMGNKPVIKEILEGMTNLNKEQIKERIEEHLAVAD